MHRSSGGVYRAEIDAEGPGGFSGHAGTAKDVSGDSETINLFTEQIDPRIPRVACLQCGALVPDVQGLKVLHDEWHAVIRDAAR